MRGPRLLAVLLVAASLARAASLQPQQRRLFSVNGLKQAAQELRQSFHSLWQRASMEGMRCTDCVQLAAGISGALYKPPDVDSEEPNIAVAGPGRRMRTRFKEPDIMAALQAACSKLAASQQLSPAVQNDCERLVGEQRLSLENHIFDRGTESLATFLCVERLRLCDWHDVVDSGEL
ncbi:hypothetical protein ABPG77_007143 [Micractinium sp. CCAP 211/92]